MIWIIQFCVQEIGKMEEYTMVVLRKNYMYSFMQML
jgi:hypothetical protein